MPQEVILHVYDVSTSPDVQKVNQYLTAVGTGAFHGGLEVGGTEWSYGYSESGTGVFSCPPKGCTAHHYRESHRIGAVNLSESQVSAIIDKMKTEWQGTDYDLLRHNCVLFSDALSKAVGAGPLPAWVTNLAGAGATVCDGAIQAVTQAQAAAIIAKAKAGEIDEKYNIRGNAQVKASEFISFSQGMDQKYKIRENATDMAGKAVVQGGVLAGQAATKAQEMDEQYKIRENAAALAAQAASKGGDLASQAAAKAAALDQQYNILGQAKSLASSATEQAKGLAQQATASAQQAAGSRGSDPVVIEGASSKPVGGCFGLCG